jgi:hypothetical protein
MKLAAAAAMLLLFTFASVDASMYDVFLKDYKPTCANGCAEWKSAGGSNATLQKIIDSMFIDKQGSIDAGNLCAMPAAQSGVHECDCGQKDGDLYIYDSYNGPWCFCSDPSAGSPTALYCTPPKYTPEQINLQLAASDVVVVGFVTYEDAKPSAPPVAMFGTSKQNMKEVLGVSHWYSPPHRNGSTPFTPAYTMSYVKFEVAERTNYFYQVKSGSSQAIFSSVFEFRSGYSSGITRVATYGDLGHSHFNAMGNLMDDAAAGRIDAIVHMGDHAYDIGFSEGRRGDAYMNAWEATLTTVPWFPIIGNHEANDGDHYKRYEAIAFGEEYGNPLKNSSLAEIDASGELTSTASSPLGQHLTQGTYYGMGLHGTTPSNTSRYASTDLGLIHMVGLDLNNLDAAQLAWLDADLTAVNKNRAATPWIMVMSHFPIFHTQTEKNAHMSLKHYFGDENEQNYSPYSKEVDFVPCDPDDKECVTIGEWQLGVGEALQPLFRKHGVDIYNAGHVHSVTPSLTRPSSIDLTHPLLPPPHPITRQYEQTFPICDFRTGAICNGKQDYDEPIGTVHITGNNIVIAS